MTPFSSLSQWKLDWKVGGTTNLDKDKFGKKLLSVHVYGVEEQTDRRLRTVDCACKPRVSFSSPATDTQWFESSPGLPFGKGVGGLLRVGGGLVEFRLLSWKKQKRRKRERKRELKGTCAQGSGDNLLVLPVRATPVSPQVKFREVGRINCHPKRKTIFRETGRLS
ncbi:hypothetical protein R1flu_027776 [Riccia fluitans]|uniref:Uncharacterized protein n=1 Tax=Riccia fluitans TaxID=41844 RepID=A0ABD1XJS8_9MARC